MSSSVDGDLDSATNNDLFGPADLRWVVTGAAGMLGRDLVEVLAEKGFQDVVPLTRADLDVTDERDVERALMPVLRPGDLVVNCAAWTAVDAAEECEAAAFMVNAVGPQLLARVCARTGAGLFQISTDYVFSGHLNHVDGLHGLDGLDGEATDPYPVDAAAAPRSAYGRTKLAGEWAVRAELPDRHRILRTAWLYGRYGGNFVTTMARLEAERDHVDVVADQFGQPTWTRDLAEQIVAAGVADVPAGTYHAVSSGQTSWHGLAQAVFELRGADPERVRPTTSAAFARPAPRPAWSVLDVSGWQKAGLAPIRAWPEALRAAAGAGVI